MMRDKDLELKLLLESEALGAGKTWMNPKVDGYAQEAVEAQLEQLERSGYLDPKIMKTVSPTMGGQSVQVRVYGLRLRPEGEAELELRRCVIGVRGLAVHGPNPG